MVIAAITASVISVFFYVRVIRLMFFADPDDAPAVEGAAVTMPSLLTSVTIAVCVAAHPVAGHRPGPGARPGRECGIIHQVSSTEGGLALPVTDPDLEARLRSRMDEVEKALYGHVQSRFPFVTEAASHLLDAGGKRFRPLLVLLAAEAGEHPSVDDVVTAACVVEITHLGSLYHDDVMDEADLRRGSESANVRWDNLVAILTGDFLFAKSSELTALLGADAVRIQAETSPGWSRGRSSRPSSPAPTRTRSTTTSRSSPARPAPSSPPRPVTAPASVEPRPRSSRRSRRTARSSAPPSSSPTTSSTSPPTRPSPARPPAPTSARASRRCRC